MEVGLRTGKKSAKLKEKNKMLKRTLDRNGMPTDLAFTKFYNIFFGIFSPDEVVFLLYVVNLHYLKKAGFSMVKSKPDHSLKCGMSSERLDMCVEKFSDMGLISVDKPKIGYYDYNLNKTNYQLLIDILAEIRNFSVAKKMCTKHFKVEKRTIDSITDDERDSWVEESKKLANSFQLK